MVSTLSLLSGSEDNNCMIKSDASTGMDLSILNCILRTFKRVDWTVALSKGGLPVNIA